MKSDDGYTVVKYSMLIERGSDLTEEQLEAISSIEFNSYKIDLSIQELKDIIRENDLEYALFYRQDDIIGYAILQTEGKYDSFTNITTKYKKQGHGSIFLKCLKEIKNSYHITTYQYCDFNCLECKTRAHIPKILNTDDIGKCRDVSCFYLKNDFLIVNELSSKDTSLTTMGATKGYKLLWLKEFEDAVETDISIRDFQREIKRKRFISLSSGRKGKDPSLLRECCYFKSTLDFEIGKHEFLKDHVYLIYKK